MTVEELKNSPLYSYEINICEEYKDLETDEWGCAFAWYGDNLGVEYNFCIDNGTNYCAIYKMEINDKTDYMETDYTTYNHYEINFDDENWKRDLEDAMCTELIKFHNL